MVRRVNKGPVVTEVPEASLVNPGQGVSKDVKDHPEQMESRVSKEEQGSQVTVAMRVLLGQRVIKGPEELKGLQETEA